MSDHNDSDEENHEMTVYNDGNSSGALSHTDQDSNDDPVAVKFRISEIISDETDEQITLMDIAEFDIFNGEISDSDKKKVEHIVKEAQANGTRLELAIEYSDGTVNTMMPNDVAIAGELERIDDSSNALTTAGLATAAGGGALALANGGDGGDDEPPNSSASDGSLDPDDDESDEEKRRKAREKAAREALEEDMKIKDQPLSESFMNWMDRIIKGVVDHGEYLTIKSDKKNKISDEQLRRAILTAVLNKGYNHLYIYSGDKINEELTKKAEEMLQRMCMEGGALEDYAEELPTGERIPKISLAGRDGEMKRAEPWKSALWGDVDAKDADRQVKETLKAAKQKELRLRKAIKREEAIAKDVYRQTGKERDEGKSKRIEAKHKALAEVEETITKCKSGELKREIIEEAKREREGRPTLVEVSGSKVQHDFSNAAKGEQPQFPPGFDPSSFGLDDETARAMFNESASGEDTSGSGDDPAPPTIDEDEHGGGAPKNTGGAATVGM